MYPRVRAVVSGLTLTNDSNIQPHCGLRKVGGAKDFCARSPVFNGSSRRGFLCVKVKILLSCQRYSPGLAMGGEYVNETFAEARRGKLQEILVQKVKIALFRHHSSSGLAKG